MRTRALLLLVAIITGRASADPAAPETAKHVCYVLAAEQLPHIDGLAVNTLSFKLDGRQTEEGGSGLVTITAHLGDQALTFEVWCGWRRSDGKATIGSLIIR